MNLGIILAVLTAILMSIGQIFFKKSSLYIESHQDLSFLMQYLSNSWLYAGLFVFGVATLIWIKAMSLGKLSALYPIQSSAYILVAIAAFYIFGERLSLINVIGMLVIIAGVFLVASR
jgi:uncharacterized membrane protein